VLARHDPDRVVDTCCVDDNGAGSMSMSMRAA
jgi:hypothetical protein